MNGHSDFGDFEAMLSANREDRERMAEARRQELRQLYHAQQTEHLQKQEYVLIKIKRQKDAEVTAAQLEKERIVKDAMSRAQSLTFNFTFASDGLSEA
jgi:hypothetical protein